MLDEVLILHCYDFVVVRCLCMHATMYYLVLTAHRTDHALISEYLHECTQGGLQQL